MSNYSNSAIELGRRIQDARYNKCWKIEDLAAATGLAGGTLQAYEQGRRMPSVISLEKLERFLDVKFEVDRDELSPFQGGHPGQRRPLNTSADAENADVLRKNLVNAIFEMSPAELSALSVVLKIA